MNDFDKIFKLVFVVIVLGAIVSVALSVATYNECKEEGSKGCLRRSLNTSRSGDIYFHDN